MKVKLYLKTIINKSDNKSKIVEHIESLSQVKQKEALKHFKPLIEDLEKFFFPEDNKNA